jgi:hypothetical protein
VGTTVLWALVGLLFALNAVLLFLGLHLLKQYGGVLLRLEQL